MSLKKIKDLLEATSDNSVKGINVGIDPFALSKSKWFKKYRLGGSGDKEESSDSGVSESLQELSSVFPSEYKWRGHVVARHGTDVEFSTDPATGKVVAHKDKTPVGDYTYNNITPEDTTGKGTVHSKPVLNTEAKSDPCWNGYEMVGTKTKEGKEVPNCVPVKETLHPNQEVLDKDKDGKIDSEDLEKTRKELKTKKISEETLDEKLEQSASLADWVKDFQDSKDNRFYGKTKEERTKQAIAAYYASKKSEEVTNESIDGDFSGISSLMLDEVNKATMKMYIKKSVKDAVKKVLDVKE